MASPGIDVYVKLPSGRTTKLDMMPNQHVSEICEHVGKEEEVPGSRVRLKYQGKLLNKSHTIGYLGIRPETILKGEVIFSKSITVYVKLLDSNTVPVTIENIATVNELRKAIETEGDTSLAGCDIKFSGRLLKQGSQLLFDAGLSEEACIQVCKCEVTPISVESSTHEAEPEAPENLKENVLSSFAADDKPVEVVFSFDTTGSMSSCLRQVRDNLQTACKRLLRDIPAIRIGIIAHGDYCDQDTYVVRSIDLTTDVDRLVDFAMNTPSTGGGDAPECYEWVLKKAQLMDWSENSAKALVVIGDCEPHPPSYTDQHINWFTELDVLKGMGVKIYGVYCKGTTSNAQLFYEEISERTGGCFLKNIHFKLITDMFLAVCYRESAPEQLEAYTEELEQDGKLTGDTKHMMEQLKNKPEIKDEKVNTKSKRYCNEFWWDIEKDKGLSSGSYRYDQTTDKWRTQIEDNIQLNTTTTSPSITTPVLSHSSRKKKSTKLSCTVM